MRRGEAAVAAARALVGVRFRPQGRQADYGLDCVGLAAAAYGIAAPGGYRLRFDDRQRLEDAIRGAGFGPVEDAAAGDLLLIRSGPGQLHLAIATDAGFVQAHVGLGRVVETPGRPAEPVLAAFRPKGEAG